jgi:ParB-like chromosome segregation protein Spo0J
MAGKRIKIEYRSLASLKLNERNARVHGPEQVNEIARSIERFGFVNPILVDKDSLIIAGEGRFTAARKLGLSEAPVIELVGLTDAQCRALALADNRIALNSAWDEELLRQEIEALRGIGEGIEGLGFDADEIQKLMIDELPSVVSEIPVSDLNDRFWISVRGPLKDQAVALKRLTDMMSDMPAVEVEIGTIGLED